MDLSALVEMLTAGLDPAEAAVVKKAVERESVKSATSGLRQQKEFEEIEAKARLADQYLQELDAQDEKGNPKGYRAWYKKYFDQIQTNNDLVKKYAEKYGTLDQPKEPAAGSAPGLSESDYQRLVDKRFQEQYAPNISTVVKNIGTVMQRHIFAGRKSPVDFDALEKMVQEKGISVVQAYEEWDKPEREKEASAATEKEVQRRVTEELQKRGASSFFPAGADATPGILSRRSTEKFDPEAMHAELLRTATTGEYSPKN